MTVFLLILNFIALCFISVILYLYLAIPAERKKQEIALEKIKEVWESARLNINKLN